MECVYRANNARFGSNSAAAALFGYFRFTPQSRRDADGLACPKSADFVAEVVDQKSTVSAWSFDAVYCTCAFWWPGL
jgi:hypothetical protein